MELETIAAGASVLAVAPNIGGAIASWTHAGRPIFRPPLPDALAAKFVRGLPCFPLVPYSNRIARGKFSFGGVDYSLPATFGGNAIHGVGWQTAWWPTKTSPSGLTLALDHAPDEFWPFAFHAEQRFALRDDTLTVQLEMRNLHAGPAPAGLGLHPYFPRGPGCTLQFGAGAAWENGPDMIPTRRVATPAAWDHSRPRLVGSVELDNCFGGWRGVARIVYPELRMAVAIEAEPVFPHLVVFIPPGKDFFAVEPVTNMNDGVNRMAATAGHGVVVLAPGATLAGRILFRVDPIRA